MSNVHDENHMTEANAQPRVRLLLLMMPEPLLRGMDIATMVSTEIPHASLPIRMHANYPILPRIASIGTGTPPIRHGMHTRMRFDPETGTIRPRRSDETGRPWIWDLVRRNGRTTSTIDWPLVNDERDPSCVKLLRLNGEASPTDLSEALESHLQTDLVTLAMNLHLQGPDQSHRITPEIARQAVGTVLERLAPRADHEHLLVYITTRTFDHLLVFGRRADSITSKSASQHDLPASVLDLLEIPKTADVPGRSVLDGMDHDESMADWPSLAPEAAQGDPIDAAVESVQDGNDEARRHVVNWLTSAWICNARYRGITATELRYAELVCELRGDAQDLFRLAVSADLVGDHKIFTSACERLRSEHPDSIHDRLATTLATAQPTQEQIRSVVDANPPDDMLPLQRRTWCDAAIRAGTKERALEQLAPLVSHGEGLPKDRLQLAELLMSDQNPRKALHALGLIGTNPVRQPRLAVFRARILLACDMQDAARKLLKAVLDATPMDSEAETLLGSIAPGNGD